MSAIQVSQKRVESFDRIIEPSSQMLSPVKETTIYPSQFPILLRERFQGKSVADVAEFLAGHWRHTRGICKKIGLKVAYALTERPE